MFFRENKAIALTLYFIKLSGCKAIEYMKLIKLLYLSERKRLENNQSLMIFDNFVAMKFGPVLSNVYTLIKENPEEKDPKEKEEPPFGWHKFFKTNPSEYDLELLESVTQDEINRHLAEYLNEETNRDEIAVLDEVWERFKDYDSFALAYYTHEYCPEWINAYVDKDVNVAEIELQDIYTVLGKTEEEIMSIYDKFVKTLEI